MKIILAAAFLALSGPLFAGPDRASVLIGSRHLGASGFQEKNTGLFLSWEREHFDISAGAYRNSYDKMSIAVTLSKPIATWERGELSVFAGAAHYPHDGRHFAVSVGDVVPIAGLQLRQGHAFAQIIPMDGKPVKAVVSFGITFGLE